MACSTSGLCVSVLLRPDGFVSLSTGGHLFLWSNFISISCSPYYDIVIGTMGTRWNSPFYSTDPASDPASSMSLTCICWLCWNKRAFTPDNLAEAIQILQRQLEKYSIFCISNTVNQCRLKERGCISHLLLIARYFANTWCWNIILKQLRCQLNSCYRITGKMEEATEVCMCWGQLELLKLRKKKLSTVINLL